MRPLLGQLDNNQLFPQKPYKCEVYGCLKKYTDPSSLRKHVKNHSKEEQEQVRLGRDTDTSQEGAGGWLEPPVSYDYSLGQYEAVGQTRRGNHHHLSSSQSNLSWLGVMVHQPNSLDSLDGEPSLPFDPVPIRYDSGDGLARIDQQNNIFSLK